ncbi:hypothetical protein PR048_002860 [Dryococelus australis]|uniref:Uncharacterized protein n=1 Tax=Dryococelus australis TaxID=614101 RepID=A0ABQ9ILD2_9NEOP|nr:hypothetical protein PR048_002860 [Dryococelus australis]
MSVNAIHDKVSTFEIYVTKKSLPLPTCILTGAMSDVCPVKLTTMEGKVVPYINIKQKLLAYILRAAAVELHTNGCDAACSHFSERHSPQCQILQHSSLVKDFIIRKSVQLLAREKGIASLSLSASLPLSSQLCNARCDTMRSCLKYRSLERCGRLCQGKGDDETAFLASVLTTYKLRQRTGYDPLCPGVLPLHACQFISELSDGTAIALIVWSRIVWYPPAVQHTLQTASRERVRLSLSHHCRSSEQGVCSGPYTTHTVAAVASLCGLRKFPSPDRKEHIAQRSGSPARPGATQTARQSDQQSRGLKKRVRLLRYSEFKYPVTALLNCRGAPAGCTRAAAAPPQKMSARVHTALMSIEVALYEMWLNEIIANLATGRFVSDEIGPNDGQFYKKCLGLALYAVVSSSNLTENRMVGPRIEPVSSRTRLRRSATVPARLTPLHEEIPSSLGARDLAREMEDPREHPPTSGTFRPNPHVREPAVNPAGIEPGSAWRETSVRTGSGSGVLCLIGHYALRKVPFWSGCLSASGLPGADRRISLQKFCWEVTPFWGRVRLFQLCIIKYLLRVATGSTDLPSPLSLSSGLGAGSLTCFYSRWQVAGGALVVLPDSAFFVAFRPAFPYRRASAAGASSVPPCATSRPLPLQSRFAGLRERSCPATSRLTGVLRRVFRFCARVRAGVSLRQQGSRLRELNSGDGSPTGSLAKSDAMIVKSPGGPGDSPPSTLKPGHAPAGAGDGGDAGGFLLLGSGQVLLGVAMAVLGAMALVHEAAMSGAGAGLWGGAVAMATGAAGLAAGLRGCYSPRGRVPPAFAAAFLALCLVAVAVANLVVVLTVTGIIRDGHKPDEHITVQVRGRGGRPVNLLASHQGKPGSIPSRVTGFSHVEIVPDDVVRRRAFSGISYFLRPFIPAPLHTHLSPSSALKTSLERGGHIINRNAPEYSANYGPRESVRYSAVISLHCGGGSAASRPEAMKAAHTSGGVIQVACLRFLIIYRVSQNARIRTTPRES